MAIWLSKVNNLGLEIVLPKPSVSNASSCNFKTIEPVLLKIPIPLVAPATLKLYKPSVLPLPAALIEPVPEVIDPSVVPIVDPPTVPPNLSRFPLTKAAPSLFPSALSKEEVASTINASISTCLVLTSISLITLSTTSKSFALPLTIIDLVVFSSVTWIGE